MLALLVAHRTCLSAVVFQLALLLDTPSPASSTRRNAGVIVRSETGVWRHRMVVICLARAIQQSSVAEAIASTSMLRVL